jgi:predicted amidohydrolase
MSKITVAYIQAKLIWEDTIANLIKFEKQFKSITEADIVVLPEMFNTGFTKNIKENAQEPNDIVETWMKKQASAYGFVIMGSIIHNNNDNYYNRFLTVHPDGKIDWYDKRHLFRMADEHKLLKQGMRNPIVKIKGWNIKTLICYDLRFPVWSRNKDNSYDLLIYVANWPKDRIGVWNTLLKARAIENQSYVVGVNRVGKDANGIKYSGDSMVINYYGDIVSELPKNKEGIGIITISEQDLDVYRDKFPAYKDADDFEISLI